jgi:hypothetical protein
MRGEQVWRFAEDCCSKADLPQFGVISFRCLYCLKALQFDLFMPKQVPKSLSNSPNAATVAALAKVLFWATLLHLDLPAPVRPTTPMRSPFIIRKEAFLAQVRPSSPGRYHQSPQYLSSRYSLGGVFLRITWPLAEFPRKLHAELTPSHHHHNATTSSRPHRSAALSFFFTRSPSLKQLPPLECVNGGSAYAVGPSSYPRSLGCVA